MTLEELTAQFRSDCDDRTRPYLSADEDVALWLSEAEQEACIRGRLIHEADDLAVCHIAVTAGKALYPLHPSVLEITNAIYTPTGSSHSVMLPLLDRVELDRTRPGWRSIPQQPRAFIQDDQRLCLDCLPITAGLLVLECYRLPMRAMTGDFDAPEIASVHQRHLVQWALHRAYSRPDAELMNPTGQKKAEFEFTRYFGLRPDVDLMRKTRGNRPHHNQAIW